MSDEKIGTVKGGQSRKTFHVYYDPHTKAVYIGSGGIFGGKDKIKNQRADDAQHAIRIAEAHVTNK